MGSGLIYVESVGKPDRYICLTASSLDKVSRVPVIAIQILRFFLRRAIRRIFILSKPTLTTVHVIILCSLQTVNP